VRPLRERLQGCKDLARLSPAALARRQAGLHGHVTRPPEVARPALRPRKGRVRVREISIPERDHAGEPARFPGLGETRVLPDGRAQVPGRIAELPVRPRLEDFRDLGFNRGGGHPAVRSATCRGSLVRGERAAWMLPRPVEALR
jgi:hypothetical protein